MADTVETPTVIYGDDVTWGKYGKDIIGSLFWEVYFNDIMMGPDEVLVQHSEWKVEIPEEDSTTLEAGKDEEEEKVPNSILEGVYKVTVTPDSTLKASYPSALVVIDGKWYDLGVLDNPIELNIVRNHRISIVWSPDTLVETFLLKRKF